jgi:DNA polymerase III epsilon subunit family exonuclease
MSFWLLEPLRQIPIACIDVETTGASAEFGDRIVELAVGRIEGGKLVRRYQTLIDPQRRISAGVTALTGITQQMLAGQPKFADQLPDLLSILKGAVILGHNVRFDLSFLDREFRVAGLELSGELGEVQVLDTVRIARRRFGRGGNGLQTLCRRLGYQPEAAHRALPDVITTCNVFERLIEPAGGWQLSLCDAIAQQGGPMGLLPAGPRRSLLPLELEEALEQRSPVTLEYLDANQNRTRRIIQPIEVRRFRGELVLVAHCQLRNDRRYFKLERIVQLTRVSDTAADDASGV